MREFFSTSRNQKILKNIEYCKKSGINVFFEIIAQESSSSLYTLKSAEISEQSLFPSEEEVLFNPFSLFKVLEVGKYSFQKNAKVTIKLEVDNNNFEKDEIGYSKGYLDERRKRNSWIYGFWNGIRNEIEIDYSNVIHFVGESKHFLENFKLLNNIQRIFFLNEVSKNDLQSLTSIIGKFEMLEEIEFSIGYDFRFEDIANFTEILEKLPNFKEFSIKNFDVLQEKMQKHLQYFHRFFKY